MVVKNIGRFLSYQGDSAPRKHGFLVGLNAIAMYVGMLTCVVALIALVLGLVNGDESLIMPAFMTASVSLLLVLVTFQRHLHYRGK